MLIKIAIFMALGLLSVALFSLRVLSPKIRRVWLERKLAKISDERERVLRLQRILELPDAYERLLVEGIVNADGEMVRFIAHPEPWMVRNFMGLDNEADNRGSSWFALKTLLNSEERAREDLYAIAVRSKPTSRVPRLIEQRAKIERLVHQLATEREHLEKLEALDRSPDPYGRLPKSREEPRAAEGEPEPELAATTESRRMRA